MKQDFEKLKEITHLYAKFLDLAHYHMIHQLVIDMWFKAHENSTFSDFDHQMIILQELRNYKSGDVFLKFVHEECMMIIDGHSQMDQIIYNGQD
jgi:hypothetical protein